MIANSTTEVSFFRVLLFLLCFTAGLVVLNACSQSTNLRGTFVQSMFWD